VSTPTKTVDLIGAPTDVGAAHRGSSMGPEAMRVAGIHQYLEMVGITVCDKGNLAGPPNPWQPPVDGYRHLPEVTAWTEAVHDAVHSSLSDAHLPILLGGDHCLAIGSVSAVARHCREIGKPLRVLWLDAHADFNTVATSPSGNIHGMPVAILRGMGPKALVGLGGRTPALDRGTVHQIGIRSVDAQEKELVRDEGMAVYDMRMIDEHGMRRAVRRALADLDEPTHVHVSFDVDFLDPEIAPGVGTTVRGGPTYREAQLCMEMIADTGMVGSLDVMELNPAKDIANRTAEVAVDLIESLFGKSTLLRLPGIPAG